MRRVAMIAAALWLSAAPAMAQEDDGVFVDPDSPTAKEYAIPLDSARRRASGTGGSTPLRGGGGATTRQAPRFGEGVGDDDGSAAPGPGSSGGSGGSGKSGGTRGSGGEPGAGTDPPSQAQVPPVAASRPGAPAGGGIGTSLAVVGGAGALLLLGAGAGYVLRRRSAISPS